MWWVVMLPSEDPGCPELFGPSKSLSAADALAAKWNATHKDDPASVVPVAPPSEM